MAQKYSASAFMETSAKNGTNIEQVFEQIGRKIKDKVIKEEEKMDKKLDKI